MVVKSFCIKNKMVVKSFCIKNKTFKK